MKKAHQKLQALLALWNERRGGKQMPSRDDLPVTTLRPWLGNLALIDLTGAAPYFRLCGTGLHARFGGEMTRKKLDTLDDARDGKDLRLCIAKVRNTFSPVQMTHEADMPGGKMIFHELCAPLAHDGTHIDTVLFASYPERRK